MTRFLVTLEVEAANHKAVMGVLARIMDRLPMYHIAIRRVSNGEVDE